MTELIVVAVVACGVGCFMCGFVAGFGYACHWMRIRYDSELDAQFKP